MNLKKLNESLNGRQPKRTSRAKSLHENLNEAFKISIEIDPKDVEGMHAEPEVIRPSVMKGVRHESIDSGHFGKYVEQLSSDSRAYSSLREAATEINRVVHESLDDLSLREDKREYNAGVTKANENILRSWRAFLREMSEFERRFK